jgi:hypothetical protein
MAESLTDKAQERGQRVRVNANFSPESYEVLTEIAERRGKSISDVLRDAIAFEEWYQDIVDSGGHVLVERDNGRLREFLVVFGVASFAALQGDEPFNNVFEVVQYFAPVVTALGGYIAGHYFPAQSLPQIPEGGGSGGQQG